jgi:hypothetical protein
VIFGCGRLGCAEPALQRQVITTWT